MAKCKREKAMYYYYRHTGEATFGKVIDGMKFRRISPRFDSVHNILWHITSWMCGAKFYEYQIINGWWENLCYCTSVSKNPIA